MSERILRAYRGKDADMLTASGAIIQNAISHQDFLIQKRPLWSAAFFESIARRINLAFSAYLGVDNARGLRNATSAVVSIVQQALVCLSEFKVQIETDFGNNKPRLEELLRRLGFAEHYVKARTRNQAALIELLYKFKTNLDNALKAEITAAGTSAALLDEIISYADALRTANITQESMKGSRKVITRDAVKEFNAIYWQVIGVAKVAARYFKNDPAVVSQFSYNQTLKAISGDSSSKQNEPADSLADSKPEAGITP